MTITIDTIRAEIQQAQQPLLERIEELEQIASEQMDYAWSWGVLMPKLIKLIPSHMADEMADSLWAELDVLFDEQRNSVHCQVVARIQAEFAQIARSRAKI